MAAVLSVSMACGGSGNPPDGATPPPADTAVPEFQHLRDEAEKIIAFLQGGAPLDADLLADTVTLYVAPEGGGAQLRASRQELQDPAAWRAGAHSFMPPAALTQLTTYPGRHVNCYETPLATRYPQLADHPHIGTMLAPATAGSCLQTWNATFVFSNDPARPQLIAVVYDQFEW
jgi:hypothetical protein